MYDDVYGISELSSYYGENKIVPVTLPLGKSQDIADYDIEMKIYNEVSKCLKIDKVPVWSIENVIVKELIHKLPSISIVEYKMTLKSNGDSAIDKTRLRIK